MSVMSVAPSRLALPRSARVLGLEFKRNAVPYVLPLLAAVFYFNTVRTADGYPPVWTLRASIIPRDMVYEFGAFAAGLAAWTGSREGRRKTADLVATTSRATWARDVHRAGGNTVLAAARVAPGSPCSTPPRCRRPRAGHRCGRCLSARLRDRYDRNWLRGGVFFPGRFTAPLVAILVLLLLRSGSARR